MRIKDRYLKFLRASYLKAVRWAKNRLSVSNPTGLILTVGASIVLLSLIGFAQITYSVISLDTITQLDQKIIEFVPDVRTPLLNEFFTVVTNMAGIVSLTFFLAALTLLAALKRLRFLPALFITALILQGLISLVLKLLVGRARPDSTLSLVTESSFSFPSGHTLAGTVFYGLIGYVLIKVSQRYSIKLAIFVATVVMILLTGISRVYLGVHFFSDVLASLVLGVMLLAIAVTAGEIHARYNATPRMKIKPPAGQVVLYSLLATVIFTIVYSVK